MGLTFIGINLVCEVPVYFINKIKELNIDLKV